MKKGIEYLAITTIRDIIGKMDLDETFSSRDGINNQLRVVLDEATSGFDVESNAYLHDIIVNHMKNKTVIMITHHYQNLEGMDEVWKLEDGKLSLLDNPI